MRGVYEYFLQGVGVLGDVGKTIKTDVDSHGTSAVYLHVLKRPEDHLLTLFPNARTLASNDHPGPQNFPAMLQHKHHGGSEIDVIIRRPDPLSFSRPQVSLESASIFLVL